MKKLSRFLSLLLAALMLFGCMQFAAAEGLEPVTL